MGTQKSGSSRDALLAAREMGLFTILLTNNYKQLMQRDEYSEVNFIQYCDLSNIERVKDIIDYLSHEDLNILAIVSFVDPYCAMAAELSAFYHKPTFTHSAMAKMQNKLESRLALKNTNLIPKFEIITKEVTLDLEFVKRMLPVVVKYIDSNGSKDVYLCDTLASYHKYTQKLFEKYPEGQILVEEYLEGTQYIVETVVKDGNVTIVGIIEQEIDFINEHFIITGYSLVTFYSDDFFYKLKKAVDTIIEKHGLENGPCHLEMRNVKGNWKLIEANPRISGAGMNNFLQYGLGINLVKETIKFALNQDYDLVPKQLRHTFAQYVVINESGTLKRITGKQAVLASPEVKFVYIKPRKNTYLTPPSSLGGRYAYVIANGDTKEDARENAKRAAKKIIFHLE